MGQGGGGVEPGGVGQAMTGWVGWGRAGQGRKMCPGWNRVGQEGQGGWFELHGWVGGSDEVGSGGQCRQCRWQGGQGMSG